MLTEKKPMPTSPQFSRAEIIASKANATANTKANTKPKAKATTVRSRAPKVDWNNAIATPGGGVSATIAAIRKTRGPNKNPLKEQVAIRLDQDVVSALRASGTGWQTRVNTALKQWLAIQPTKRKTRGQ
jgi:hypothetical protein